MFIVRSFNRLLLALLCLTLGACALRKNDAPPWQIGRFQKIEAEEEDVLKGGLRVGFQGFTKPGFAEARTGIYSMEVFDPKKTPVLFIHGLLSEPQTWKKMTTLLREDPAIRENYQFWFYSYPSGTPVVPSGAILKKHLDTVIAEVERKHKISMNRRLIVVGHSMGGILAKSLVSRTGDKLWDAAFTAPIEEFDLTEEEKRLTVSAFRYTPRTYVKEVIFLATPHRGSQLANNFIGRLGSRLSARPKVVETLSRDLVTKNSERLTPQFSAFVAEKVNSISTLRPESPVTKLLADLPVDRAVAFHTIVGIKPGLEKRALAEQGDGVVPLESTFVKGAFCEAGVRSGHSVHTKKQAAELVDAILQRRAGVLTEAQLAERISQIDLVFARVDGKTIEGPSSPVTGQTN